MSWKSGHLPGVVLRFRAPLQDPEHRVPQAILAFSVKQTRALQPPEPDHRSPHLGLRLGGRSAPIVRHSHSMRGPLLHGHVRLRGELPLSFVGVQHVRHRCRLECGATS